MVYGIVGLTLLCLTVKGYCGKRTSGCVRSMGDSALFNLLRMLFCMLIGGVLVLAEGSLSFLRLEPGMLGICLLAGLSNALFLVAWLNAVQKNTLVSMDVGMTMGSLLPAILCACLFGEAIAPSKLVGFALILGATVILAGHSKKDKKGSFLGILLLILAAVGDGMTGAVQQFYRQYYSESGNFTHGVIYPKTVYHFYTYVFSALILLLVWIVFRLLTKKEDIAKQDHRLLPKIPVKVVGYIFIMAVCMFTANYLQTVATNNFGMSSQVLYPILKGGCLITVNFVAAIFFGEKVTVRTVLGSATALGGMILMNVL